MTAQTTPAPYVMADGEIAPNPLEEWAGVTVQGRRLRAGMILLDDLSSPAAIVDRRIGSAGRRTAASRFLVENLDRPGWSVETIGDNARVRVGARPVAAETMEMA